MTTVKLQSAEEDIFEVEIKVAKMSVTIKSLLEHVETDDDDSEDNDNVVPLPTIESRVLEKVIEYAKYHQDHAPPLFPPEIEDVDGKRDKLQMGPWDKEFIKVDEEMVFKLLTAANFLDIKGLLDLTGKACALLLKECKTAENIRAKYNIKNDFSDEELKKIKKDNEWHAQRAIMTKSPKN